jgi:hypothetical protein
MKRNAIRERRHSANVSADPSRRPPPEAKLKARIPCG